MFKLSERANKAVSSVTLEINEKVNSYKKEGKDVFNLTSGQLPFRPEGNFIHAIQSQLSFLASYQYAPVKGLKDLRTKLKLQFVNSRFSDWSKNVIEEFNINNSIVISNGSKHSIYNLLASILNPGDEVVLFAPYWVSFPEMIKFWEGVPRIVSCHQYDSYTPDLDQLRELLEKSSIKAIIINSPNNPTGVHYSESWMKQFAQIIKHYPDILIISDEIYEQLYYYDPAPTFFYQYDASLLEQTVIINGISKTLAATGLRLGTAIGPKHIIDAMAKLQSQSTSGTNSLIQHALREYDERLLRPYLFEIRVQLRRNAEILKDMLRDYDLTACWYQTTSAFYFMLDFMRSPLFKNKFAQVAREDDKSQLLCDLLLSEKQVAIIPGTNFGTSNCARISMTLDPELFEIACRRICEFLKD